ncbi:type IV pilus modification PilV family protein [Couchioplanes azureus]|uniref:type IV pilus modification PilV family protein n=1 Tax=Couchioplanes caeruleus TaxID=56438 RepID=UPI00166FAB0C|nr:prepilin-type N-terminal cleavage/methylation domain-containing protein [Couchioplanes caeruleus]
MNEAADHGANAAGGRPDDAGFALLELMMAMFVVGLVGTFTASLQLISLATTRAEANRQVAAQLVSGELDRLRGLGGKEAAKEPPVSNPVINGLEFEMTTSVTPCWQVLTPGDTTPECVDHSQPGSAEMARVLVTVTWPEGGGMRSQRGDAMINAEKAIPS